MQKKQANQNLLEVFLSSSQVWSSDLAQLPAAGRHWELGEVRTPDREIVRHARPAPFLK